MISFALYLFELKCSNLCRTYAVMLYIQIFKMPKIQTYHLKCTFTLHVYSIQLRSELYKCDCSHHKILGKLKQLETTMAS